MQGLQLAIPSILLWNNLQILIQKVFSPSLYEMFFLSPLIFLKLNNFTIHLLSSFFSVINKGPRKSGDKKIPTADQRDVRYNLCYLRLAGYQGPPLCINFCILFFFAVPSTYSTSNSMTSQTGAGRNEAALSLVAITMLLNSSPCIKPILIQRQAR